MSNTPAPNTDPQALANRVSELRAQLGQLQASAEKARASGVPASAPHARRGEDPLSSRGYSYTKLFQVLAKQADAHDAKVETDLHNRFLKLYQEHGGWQRTEPGSVLAPLASGFLPGAAGGSRDLADEVRQVVKAGVAGADPHEVAHLKRRFGIEKTLSWQDETALGVFVTPPVMGELIDVLRNNEVLMAAGCRTVGMPPNGRMVWPRQTGASTAYYVGESASITASEPTTGDLTLQAKKVAALVKVPNELFRYSSIAVESFLREDMTKVMALKMDKELLEGVGSSVAPKGLITYSGITSHTSIGTPADGNSGYPLQPEDLLQMISKVEEKNAEFKSWILRPALWAYIANKRADAVTAGDGKGMFLFNLLRDVGTDHNLSRLSGGTLQGYPVVKSTQISNVRTRGSGAVFTYLLGGDFSDYMLAISPTMEFAATQQGDTAFQQDQTWIRAIMAHDGAPRREASFVWTDALLTA
jgi:HK97 family phage major capsid protein